MRNPLIALCLVFGLLITAGAQNPSLKEQIKTFKNNKKFTVKYDKFKDQTTVTAGTFAVFQSEGKEPESGYDVYAQLVFVGDAPEDVISLGLICTGNRWQFLDNRQVYLLVDGERQIHEAARGSDTGKRTDHFITREWLLVHLSPEAFGKIANAKSVEIKAGELQTRLKDDHLKAFRDLLSLR